MPKENKFKNDVASQWCPGCPNFKILEALQSALVELKKSPHQVCLVSGIGQAAKLPHYLHCNFFNGLHGRALPAAIGINAANPQLTTMVVTGDGDCYGEGGNHFLHALRRNPDITVVVHNNEIYALTKGQASPTTPTGEKRSIQAQGVQITPLNMPAVAILHGCGFVARGFAGEPEHLKDLLVAAVRYRGLSYIDVIQPCITWGTRPFSWYKDRIYRLDDAYDPADQGRALEKTMEWSEKIPIGVLYKTTERAVFGHRFRDVVDQRSLPELDPIDAEEIKSLLQGFRSAE
ncbi:MAG: thiamine pyrophosphate-dependent enzyme [Desulfobacterales bacterium]|jgi:2-oxoglutarate ferredoxin oxidoreductase subunit beta